MPQQWLLPMGHKWSDHGQKTSRLDFTDMVLSTVASGAASAQRQRFLLMLLRRFRVTKRDRLHKRSSLQPAIVVTGTASAVFGKHPKLLLM